jgi:hypothetical protein
MVLGVILALILVPTAAMATTTLTTIIGHSGFKADVAPTTQLLTGEAAPSKYVQSADVQVISNGNYFPIVAPAAGAATVVDEIHVDTYATSGSSGFILDIQTTASCSGTTDGTYSHTLNPGEIGETDIPMSPGLVVPAGDSLCVASNGPSAEVNVSGYNIAAAAG